jgi:allantoin racemase
MRIAYVLPGPLSRTSLGPSELTRREEILRQWAPRDVEITVREVEAGPASIESAYEEYLSLPQTAAVMTELEQDGFDAAILGCFGDPCLDALYEVTTRLIVVGPGAASFHLAAMLSDRFGIVTIDQGVVGPIRRQVANSGLSMKLAGIAVVDTPVLELAGNADATITRTAAAAARLVEQGAEAVVLGCMSMAFMDLGPLIQAQVGVPVVNPVQAGLVLAQGRARFGMRHSKLAYPTPRKLAAGTRLADLFLR